MGKRKNKSRYYLTILGTMFMALLIVSYQNCAKQNFGGNNKLGSSGLPDGPNPLLSKKLFFADFDNNAKEDILVFSDLTANPSMDLYQINNLAVSNVTRLPDSGPDWEPLVVADFNKDGKSDIIWRNKIDSIIRIWAMDGSTVAQNLCLATICTDAVADISWSIAGVGDFNGDGFTDILWVRKNPSGSTDVRVWALKIDNPDPAGFILENTSIGPVAAGWELVAVGNTNSDSRTEIVWRFPMTGEVLIWQMKTTGTNKLDHTAVSIPFSMDSSWKVLTSGTMSSGQLGILWNQMTAGQNKTKSWIFLNSSNSFSVQDRDASNTTAMVLVDQGYSVMGSGRFTSSSHDIVLAAPLGRSSVFFWNLNVDSSVPSELVLQ